MNDVICFGSTKHNRNILCHARHLFFYSGSSKMSEDSFFSMPFLTLDVNPSVSAGLPQQCLNLKLIECHVADELWRDLKRQWGYGNAH